MNIEAVAALFGVSILREYAADSISDSSLSAALLARESAALVLRDHDDAPSIVAATSGGYLVSGSGHAILIGADGGAVLRAFGDVAEDDDREDTDSLPLDESAKVPAALSAIGTFRVKKSALGGAPWIVGTTKDGKFRIDAQVFDTPSYHGINAGRVSKLYVSPIKDGKGDFSKRVVSYEREWERKPTSPESRKIVQAFLRAYPGTDPEEISAQNKFESEAPADVEIDTESIETFFLSNPSRVLSAPAALRSRYNEAVKGDDEDAILEAAAALAEALGVSNEFDAHMARRGYKECPDPKSPGRAGAVTGSGRGGPGGSTGARMGEATFTNVPKGPSVDHGDFRFTPTKNGVKVDHLHPSTGKPIGDAGIIQNGKFVSSSGKVLTKSPVLDAYDAIKSKLKESNDLDEAPKPRMSHWVVLDRTMQGKREWRIDVNTKPVTNLKTAVADAAKWVSRIGKQPGGMSTIHGVAVVSIEGSASQTPALASAAKGDFSAGPWTRPTDKVEESLQEDYGDVMLYFNPNDLVKRVGSGRTFIDSDFARDIEGILSDVVNGPVGARARKAVLAEAAKKVRADTRIMAHLNAVGFKLVESSALQEVTLSSVRTDKAVSALFKSAANAPAKDEKLNGIGVVRVEPVASPARVLELAGWNVVSKKVYAHDSSPYTAAISGGSIIIFDADPADLGLGEAVAPGEVRDTPKRLLNTLSSIGEALDRIGDRRARELMKVVDAAEKALVALVKAFASEAQSSTVFELSKMLRPGDLRESALDENWPRGTGFYVARHLGKKSWELDPSHFGDGQRPYRYGSPAKAFAALDKAVAADKGGVLPDLRVVAAKDAATAKKVVSDPRHEVSRGDTVESVTPSSGAAPGAVQYKVVVVGKKAVTDDAIRTRISELANALGGALTPDRVITATFKGDSQSNADRFYAEAKAIISAQHDTPTEESDMTPEQRTLLSEALDATSLEDVKDRIERALAAARKSVDEANHEPGTPATYQGRQGHLVSISGDKATIQFNTGDEIVMKDDVLFLVNESEDVLDEYRMEVDVDEALDDEERELILDIIDALYDLYGDDVEGESFEFDEEIEDAVMAEVGKRKTAGEKRKNRKAAQRRARGRYKVPATVRRKLAQAAKRLARSAKGKAARRKALKTRRMYNSVEIPKSKLSSFLSEAARLGVPPTASVVVNGDVVMVSLDDDSFDLSQIDV